MHNGQDEEARRQVVRDRLKRSADLMAEVHNAIKNQRIPAAMIPEPAAEQLDKGGELESLVPVHALEAIVKRIGRPPLLVRNDLVELEPLPDFPQGTDALIKKVEPSVKSVGRVEFVNHSMAWGGTGWVIAEDGATRVVATNRHVAKLVAAQAADSRGFFLRSPASGLLYGAEIDFKEEVNSDPGDARPFEVTEIVYLADDASPDVALLRIVGDGLPPALPLADSEAPEGARVALIGYPAYDPRNDIDDQARYFRDLFEVKRLAPGFVMQELRGRKALTHDCTSLGGNSGSPLISLEDGKVIGLHFSGLYGVANSAVGVGTLRKLADGDRPVLSPGLTVSSDRRREEASADGSHPVTFFRGRKGYEPEFLSKKLIAPWPGMTAAQEQLLARPSDGSDGNPFELRYTHFGVRYNQVRKQPIITAVNIDGEHPVKIKRTGDRWFLDERIPAEVQLTQADYVDPQIDRGHMVRREDPNWDTGAKGVSDVTALAIRANADTFHYTNAALQHSRLNQGKQLWLGLEEYILNSARTEGFKVCVFTGPVFRGSDPEIASGLAVPQEFWKLVVMLAAGGEQLHATAYLLSQGDLIRELLEERSRVEAVEGFALGAYRTFQISVTDLADATGLDLSPYVAADPLGLSNAGQEAVATGEPVFLPLSRLEQIVT